jgi:hypothetical protein
MGNGIGLKTETEYRSKIDDEIILVIVGIRNDKTFIDSQPWL